MIVPDGLGAVATEAADGYAKIRSWLAGDGALGAPTKALLTSAAAAVSGKQDLTCTELRRGLGAGLSTDEVRTGATALLLGRGESACRRLLAAAGEQITPEERPTVDARDGRRYFLDYLGLDELPVRMAALRRHAPEVFEAYHHMHHAALGGDRATARLAELVLCAANAAELQAGFVRIHAEGARRHGAGDAELVEAVLCAFPVSGVAAWAVGAEALFG